VPTLSVVVPYFNNRESLPELLAQISTSAASLQAVVEIIVVDDGSKLPVLSALKQVPPMPHTRLKLIRLSRNFGSFSAIQTGLSAATGKRIAVLSADLQEPPWLLESFFEELESGEISVVLGSRESRQDKVLQSISAKAYWFLYRRFVFPQVPKGGVDVFACTQEVARTLVNFRESNTSLIGLLLWAGYPTKIVKYDRLERQHGQSGWSLTKRLKYMTNSIFAFTHFPILALQVLGGLGVLASVLIGVVVAYAWWSGAVIVPGYAPIMLAISLSTSINLLGLGLIGSYVWRTFENSKNRPSTLISTASEVW
jgi:glycosyltransferase involved in cell wall biosynthesis